DSAQVRRLVARAIARRAAMRRMNALPEQVLSGLSHELRTPLNVIMGYSAILREEGEDSLSAEQRLALDRIQSNPASLLAIVETEDVLAGRAPTRPPRLLGFGLRLAGRLVRVLGASLTMAASPEGTTCHLVVPDLAAAEYDRTAQAATA